MTDKNTIGKKIKNRRLELGLTQSELSEISTISIPTISNIEGDKRLPSIDTLIQLAPALSCSIDYLILGQNGQIPIDVIRTTVEAKVLKAVATLIEYDIVFPRGDVDWDGNYGPNDYLDFKNSAPSNILLQFAEQVEKLVSLKSSTKKINSQFDELVSDLIESYKNKFKLTDK